MKGSLLFLFCFFAISATKIYGTCTGLTPRQQDSCQLIDFYNSTDGANWTGVKWTTTSPMNTWNGITLTSGGRVRTITLTNRAKGTIPTTFSLPELETISITYTAKNASNIGGQLFNFANFPKLRSLTLTNTNVTDTLPDNLSDSLVTLALTGNPISGKIPAYSSPKLVTLSLRSNLLTGFKSKLSCPNLVNLYLEGNVFTEPIPNFNLPALKILNLSNSNFSGTIPAFDTLPSIEELYLQTNALTGSLPAFNISTLKILNVTTNKLSGTIPSLTLPNLVEIRLSDNLFTGSFPNFNLPALQIFYLGTNPGITGSLPLLDNLPNLKQFMVSGNTSLSGPLPLFTYNPLIEVVTLTSNQLEDTIPNYRIASLRILNLNNNRLTGRLPKFKLDNLEEFYASENGIVGPIPLWDSMPKLKKMYVSSNRIHSQLPVGIKLPAITDLRLDNNNIDGKIPLTFLEHMPVLEILILGGNRLWGEIPDFVSGSLNQLNLSYNFLTGGLPTFLNALKLKKIYVGHNYLAGNIPNYKSQAGRDTSNMSLNISKNYFTYGEIAGSSYNTINDYVYFGQVIPLEYNAATNKLSVNSGYVSSSSENTYQWSKRCSSTTTVLSETSNELTLPGTPDGCRYRCEITNSVLSNPGSEKLIIGSYYFNNYLNPVSTCSYINDTMYCANVLGEVRQNIIYKGDSLFSKGVTPLHFKYPEYNLKMEAFNTTSESVEVSQFDTSGYNNSRVFLPDYVSEYVNVPGKGKKILGNIEYGVKHTSIGVNDRIDYSDIGVEDLCSTCDTIEADFLYFYASLTDTTNLYNAQTGEIVIPFKFVDYKRNTAFPEFKIYYSNNGVNTPASYVEISSGNITVVDSTFFVKFTLPPGAVSSSTIIRDYENFKYKIEAKSQSGRAFTIVSDYFLYYRRDVPTVGYLGNYPDRFNVIENLKRPTCQMYGYALFDNIKLRTGNNYPVTLSINNKVLLSGFSTEDPAGNVSKIYTASIQRGSFKVDKLPACYTIEAAYNTSIKTFLMDYKLVCSKKSQ